MEELSSLVLRAQTGDLDAYGMIVRRFQEMAYGCGYSILGDFHLAQDAAQEAFLQAYRDLPMLREPAAFPGWFRRIVFKHSDRLRRGKSVPTVPLEAVGEVASPGPGPDQVAEENEMKDQVLNALQRLPPNERLVLTLFHIRGYSQKEIAAFLEVPVTTIRSRLYTSQKRLKQRMMAMVDETLKRCPLPEDFADLVVRRAASEQELQQAAGSIPWHARNRPEHFQSLAEAGEAGIYVVGEEGRLEAAGYFNETTLTIGGVVCKAARPNEMGAESAGVPDPAFTKGFQACFQLARQQGIHLAAVHGSQYDHAFCGFVPCFYYPVVRLSCDRTSAIASRATLAEADEEQKQEARKTWQLDPYAPKMAAYIGGGVPHLVRQEGRIVGYANINPHFSSAEHCGMPFGHVTDVTVQTREAALAVIRLAGELAAKANDGEICLMQSHMTLITQTMLSLGGTYILRPSCPLVGLDAEMVAILDPIGLSQELHDEFQSRLNASPAHQVNGCFSIEMSGTTVGFVVRSGQVEILPQEQKVHCILPRWVLTRLYLGYYSGEDLLAMGPIPSDRSDGRTPDRPDLDMQEFRLPENEAALFKALFPRLWPCSTPDPDVWPWVIGKDGPRYQHEEGKTPEMKARIDALKLPWLDY